MGDIKKNIHIFEPSLNETIMTELGRIIEKIKINGNDNKVK